MTQSGFQFVAQGISHSSRFRSKYTVNLILKKGGQGGGVAKMCNMCNVLNFGFLYKTSILKFYCRLLKSVFTAALQQFICNLTMTVSVLKNKDVQCSCVFTDIGWTDIQHLSTPS